MIYHSDDLSDATKTNNNNVCQQRSSLYFLLRNAMPSKYWPSNFLNQSSWRTQLIVVAVVFHAVVRVLTCKGPTVLFFKLYFGKSSLHKNILNPLLKHKQQQGPSV